MMTTGRQSGKIVRSREKEEGVEAALESFAKAGAANDATLAVSAAVRSEAESAYEVLTVAISEYCLLRDATSNKLEDLYGPEKTCALFGTVSTYWQTTRTLLAVRGVRQLRSLCVL